MTEQEIGRVLYQKMRARPGARRAIRASKLKGRFGKDHERLTAEIKRTREKLDILQNLARDWEQKLIAEFGKQ